MLNQSLSWAARCYREKLLNDPFRPIYHFTLPDSDGRPGDPNGFFFAQGRYHLMYLYRHADQTFHWGHVSSLDLLHWRHHPDALSALPGDAGCFSGGAFVDEDNTAWLSYWIFNDEDMTNQGVGLACSKPPYDQWERLPHAVIPSDQWGIIIDESGMALGCADPSNIWKKKGIYYMQTGNKAVLDAFGREQNAPEHYRGDWTELFKSDDLKHWKYCGRFYQRKVDDSWTKSSEDNMCPSFLPLPNLPEDGNLTDSMLQLFISHNMGCQYYTGKLEGERFIPEQHGRMSWVDDTFFAPEASLDAHNRHIMFAWLRDDLPNQFELSDWCGVYSLPRQLWIDQHDKLCMKPISELTRLRVQKFPCSTDQKKIHVPTPLSFELQVTANPKENFCIHVLCRENGNRVVIGYDVQKALLYVDATSSGTSQRSVRECAPLELLPQEKLELTCYVDHSVVEVFANQRQAITRRIYNQATVLPYIEVNGADLLDIWEMGSCMPY